ncbi:hypothetical protein ACFL27_01535 [candidate division CSSED10-310 bacterium]|uniref:Tetratricopeptide repeat protein n=1 Tax=candidate division CSSED10-310 bacterium TaxID=2855610 RepID=A0ABV6YRP6_UNCC1
MKINKRTVIEKAEKLSQKGLWEKAIVEYRKILAEYKHDIKTRIAIGDLYAKYHSIDNAINEYKIAATGFEKEGLVHKAIALYKKIIRLDSSREDICSILAQLYQQSGHNFKMQQKFINVIY